MIKFLKIFFCFIFLFSSVFASFETYQQKIIPEFVKGNYNLVQPMLINLIKQNLDDPTNEVFFRHLENIIDKTGNYQEAYNLCKLILKNKSKIINHNTLLSRALAMETRILINQGKIQEAKKEVKKLNFITDWQFIGSFDNEAGSGFNKIFPPEQEIDFTKEYEGKIKKVKWFTIPVNSLLGNIDFQSIFSSNTDSLAYALTYIYIPLEKTINIRTGSAGAMKIWINNQLIFSEEEYRKGDFDQNIISIKLNSGWHKVLVKLCVKEDNWNFYFRLTDEKGLGLEGCKVNVNLQQKFLQEKSLQEKLSFNKILPNSISTLQLDDKEMNCAYLGYLYYDLDLKDLALEQYKKAQKLNSTFSFYPLMIGTIFEEKDSITDAIIFYSQAINIDSNCLEAKRKLSLIYANEKKDDMAIKLLQEVVKSNSQFILTQLNLANKYFIKGWEFEAICQNKLALSYNFQNALSYYYLGYFYEVKDDYKKSIFYYKQALKRNYYLNEVRKSLAVLYYKLGEIKKSIKEYKTCLILNPFDISVYFSLGQIYVDKNEYEKSLNTYFEILKICPDNAKAYEKIGLVYHFQNKEKESFESWKKSLDFVPNAPYLREYIEFLNPNFLISSEEQKENVKEIIEEKINIENYKEADAVVLLDKVERVIFEDGTSNYTIHRIIKILSNEGKSKYGEVEIGYNSSYQQAKVRKASTIKKDGTSIEAISIRNLAISEQDMYSDAQVVSISMPSLEKEDVIEYIVTIENFGENIFKNNFWDTFYFQEHDPVKLSKYILTIPKSLNLKIVPQNVNIIPKIEEKNNSITYVWEMKNSTTFIHETIMPSINDILPKISITTIENWDTVWNWYHNLCIGQFEPDEEIKNQAIKLTIDKKTKEEKIKAIYNYIVSEIRYVGIEFGINAYKPHKATEVLKNKYGDCKDKSGLMISMLESIGIKSYIALVSTIDNGEVNLDCPSPSQFNHAIVAIPDDKKEDFIFVDCTITNWNFGTLPGQIQGIKSFIIQEESGIFKDTPVLDFSQNQFSENAKIELKENGSIKSNVSLSVTGFFSALYREALKDKKTEKENVERESNEDCSGASLITYKVSDMENLDLPVKLFYEFESNNFAQINKNKIIFHPVFRPINLINLVAKSERIHPLQFEFLWQYKCILEIIFPRGFKIESIPDNVELNTSYGSYTLKYKLEKNKIICERNFFHTAKKLKQEEYNNLKTFYENIAKYEKMLIILEKNK
ncbi:MAG: DUF3857 domain-containing protein [bacterium]